MIIIFRTLFFLWLWTVIWTNNL